MPTFEFRTELPCSVERLFEYLIRPANIAELSNPSLGLVFSDPPEVLSQGDEIEFQIASFGQVHTVRHKITELNQPHRVVEQQIAGPMSAWRHLHVYEPSDNGCVKLDIVEYETPGGLVGFFLTPDKVDDQLDEGFYFREQKLKKLIEQGELE